jgi:3-ketosteroid 9alpha-monooxygenase subunit A
MNEKGLSVYPRGWFVIAFSEELKPLDVLSLHYFGREFVLFRTSTGDASVLDAHCPHLGAHLGDGRVEGEVIYCPFHQWAFDVTGQCVDIPYAKKIPKQAHSNCWPVCERSGMVFMYYDEEGGTPEYEIPLIDGYGEPGWTRWDHRVMRIQTHPREIVENVADRAHFMPVHGTDAKEFVNEFEGHMAVQRNRGTAYPRGGGEDHYDLIATYYGPAYQVTRMLGVLNSCLINAHTPVDEQCLDLRFAVSLEVNANEQKMRAFSESYVNNLRVGFLEDVAIWEHKMWRDRPVLCDGDGPIAKLRKWYRQFYQPRPIA